MIELYQIVLSNDGAQRNGSWRITLAPVSTPGQITILGTGYRTARAARQTVDTTFPEITWANAKKAYVKVDNEDIPPW